jgi:hypothetical protein
MEINERVHRRRRKGQATTSPERFASIRCFRRRLDGKNVEWMEQVSDDQYLADSHAR